MDYGIHGKPYLKEYQDVYFNFSHCSQGVVCAVSINDIGVDIETIDEKRMFFSSDIFTKRTGIHCKFAERRFLPLMGFKGSYCKMYRHRFGLREQLY